MKEEQKINETTKYKVIGLTLETRPDYINEKDVLIGKYTKNGNNYIDSSELKSVLNSNHTFSKF